MKKYLLIIFASVLFVFDGSAQCNVPLTQKKFSSSNFLFVNDTVFCFNDAIMNLGENAVIEGGSGNYEYKWYYATDNKSFYEPNYNDNIISWTLISGASSASYSPIIKQSIRYKRVTTDINCTLLRRNDFSVVLHLLKVDMIEAFQKTCSPTRDVKIIDKTGDALWENIANWYIIQWESAATETGTYAPIIGATNFLYTPVMKSNTMYYRRTYNVGSRTSGRCDVQTTNAVAINPVSCLTFSSSITGPTSVAPNQTATYSVAVQTGMTYLWSVIGGTITGGQGTYTITIMWDGGASATARTSAENYSVSVKETNDIALSNTTTEDVSIGTTTSINKSFAVAGISVFPNPIKDQFSIVMPQSSTAVNYTLYSSTGLAVQSGLFTSSTSGTSIQTSLPAGIYQLVLNYDGVFTSTRLAVY